MSNPTSIALKRIMNDIKDLSRDPLDKEGIFHHYDERNVMNAKIMMIGPEDTPYENGFYFFNFTFPDDYPFNPPKVKYETRDGNIRFNPNLYTCGKVCLSLINTWDGPKWTACQTIRSILISLRGLVLGVKHPLQNEPGYEKVTDTRSTNYNDVIHHENFRVAVVKMVNQTPNGFEVFQPKMIEYLKSKYPWYYTRLNELSKFDNTKVNSIYSMSITRNFSYQLKEIEKILEKNGMKITNSPNTTGKTKEETFKHNENAPSKSANDFYVGYKLTSENDSKMYVVKEILHHSKKIKTWIECEPEEVLEISSIQELPKKKEEKMKKTKIMQKSPKSPKTSQNSKELSKESPEITQNSKELSKEFPEITQNSKEVKHKVPNSLAKKYDVGFSMKSENDGKMYVVKEISSGTKKFKRWVLLDSTVVVPIAVNNIKIVDKIEVNKLEEKPELVQPLTTKVAQVKVIDKDDETDDKKQKLPNVLAKDFKVGDEYKSENDGKIYVVKEVNGKGGSKYNKWILKK